ncbi:hypothetical protein SRHO_G00075120 [Serrasalmus rhombeus]
MSVCVPVFEVRVTACVQKGCAVGKRWRRKGGIEEERKRRRHFSKTIKITIEESSDDDDDDEEERSHSVRDIGKGLLSTKPSVSLLSERELPPTPIQSNTTDLYKWLGTFFGH